MLSKSKKPETVQDDPRYIEAAGKLNELRDTYTRMGEEIETARRSRSEMPANASALVEAASAYLSSGGAAVAHAPITLEAIDGMIHRRGVVREAMRLQEQRVEVVRGEIGREIAKAARPEYEAIVKRMAEALAALSAVADEEAAFRERMEEERIPFASIIPPVPIESMRLSVYASRANRWFDEVERDYFRVKIERRRNP